MPKDNESKMCGNTSALFTRTKWLFFKCTAEKNHDNQSNNLIERTCRNARYEPDEKEASKLKRAETEKMLAISENYGAEKAGPVDPAEVEKLAITKTTQLFEPSKIKNQIGEFR